jgi:phosphomannomutase
VSQAILARLMPGEGPIEVTFDAGGRVHGGREPGAAAAPLAGALVAAWLERKATLSKFFTQALGFDEIVRINALDGVRIFFKCGDVAHVRPSGNAPQLRIYANSDSQARADQIVELALQEPQGILRQMVNAFAG